MPGRPPSKPPARSTSLGELLSGIGSVSAKGARVGLVVILRAAEVNRPVLEKVAQSMVLAEGDDWEKMKPAERHSWILRAASAVRALSTHFEG